MARRRKAHLSLLVGLLSVAAAIAACGDIERLPRQPNERPTAELVVPPFADSGATVVLDGSGSSDVDGFIAEYRFAPGDRDEVLVTGEPAIAYVYRSAGDFTVTLTVVDNRGGKDTVAAPISVR